MPFTPAGPEISPLIKLSSVLELRIVFAFFNGLRFCLFTCKTENIYYLAVSEEVCWPLDWTETAQPCLIHHHLPSTWHSKWPTLALSIEIPRSQHTHACPRVVSWWNCRHASQEPSERLRDHENFWFSPHTFAEHQALAFWHWMSWGLNFLLKEVGIIWLYT